MKSALIFTKTFRLVMAGRWSIAMIALFSVGMLIVLVQEIPSASAQSSDGSRPSSDVLQRGYASWLYDLVAKGCRGVGDISGWYCDDPLSRWAWRKLNGCGGCNCDQFCRKKGKSGGRCISNSNPDQSSWCDTKG